MRGHSTDKAFLLNLTEDLVESSLWSSCKACDSSPVGLVASIKVHEPAADRRNKYYSNLTHTLIYLTTESMLDPAVMIASGKVFLLISPSAAAFDSFCDFRKGNLCLPSGTLVVCRRFDSATYSRVYSLWIGLVGGSSIVDCRRNAVAIAIVPLRTRFLLL
jgi:hypothetical protein